MRPHGRVGRKVDRLGVVRARRGVKVEEARVRAPLPAPLHPAVRHNGDAKGLLTHRLGRAHGGGAHRDVCDTHGIYVGQRGQGAFEGGGGEVGRERDVFVPGDDDE